MGPSYFFFNNLIKKLKFKISGRVFFLIKIFIMIRKTNLRKKKILRNKLSFINLDINNFSKC
jgi:hypothetical protein